MIKKFDELIGETLTKVVSNGESVVFTLKNGDEYQLWHQQDCCEWVRVEDVIGELGDLIGSPLTMAEEVSNSDASLFDDGEAPESFTWTFYKLATIKGYVTIRWLGSSNGYYSESVDFDKI